MKRAHFSLRTLQLILEPEGTTISRMLFLVPSQIAVTISICRLLKWIWYFFHCRFLATRALCTAHRIGESRRVDAPDVIISDWRIIIPIHGLGFLYEASYYTTDCTICVIPCIVFLSSEKLMRSSVVNLSFIIQGTEKSFIHKNEN